MTDVTAIADAFCHGSEVIVDLADAESELARRILDFCSGLATGRGKLDRIGEGRFLIGHDAPRRYRLERFYG